MPAPAHMRAGRTTSRSGNHKQLSYGRLSMVTGNCGLKIDAQADRVDAAAASVARKRQLAAGCSERHQVSWAVGLQLDGVGVQEHPHVGGTAQLVAVGWSEACRGAQAIQPGQDAGAVEQRLRPQPCQPGSRLIIAGAELADVVRAPVVRFQLGRGQGPAAMRDPRARREVERLQEAGPPGPQRRRAAEGTHTIGVEGEVRQADRGRLGKGLCGVVGRQPAALDDADVDLTAGELARQRDAGGAGADDANGGFQACTVRQFVRFKRTHWLPAVYATGSTTTASCFFHCPVVQPPRRCAHHSVRA